ncbi:hypothetical protein LG409_03770 [Halomonas sp. NyZ770]|uniref:hypothetical protein n=1 Tax=Halomonas sp. NyZ770 TaxID=2883106 RepID=UPI000BC32812|nr:hypothetical protein [Halomonas sp. NyZ770]ATH76443.1 hypothetical protein CLM76_01920 [Halomonas hydrothermalis]UDM08032.1 hypothetical protein LG409_03770 [Halomonas sp. NyZ770]
MSRDARTSGYVFPMPGSALLQAWREGYTLDRLKRAGIKRETGKLAVVRTLTHAERVAWRWLGGGR